MDNMYTEALVEMGISLGQLAAKGTASAVSKKIRAIKNEKDTEKAKEYLGDCKLKKAPSEEEPSYTIFFGSREEAEEALAEEPVTGTVLLVPKAAFKASQKDEKLLYKMLLFNYIYGGFDDLSTAADELGVSEYEEIEDY